MCLLNTFKFFLWKSLIKNCIFKFSQNGEPYQPYITVVTQFLINEGAVLGNAPMSLKLVSVYFFCCKISGNSAVV